MELRNFQTSLHKCISSQICWVFICQLKTKKPKSANFNFQVHFYNFFKKAVKLYVFLTACNSYRASSWSLRTFTEGHRTNQRNGRQARSRQPTEEKRGKAILKQQVSSSRQKQWVCGLIVSIIQEHRPRSQCCMLTLQKFRNMTIRDTMNKVDDTSKYMINFQDSVQKTAVPALLQ